MSLVSTWSFTSTGMQCSGPTGPLARVHRIEPVGFVERTAVHGLQRVECRSRMIVCLDALQVIPDQITAADVPGLQLTMNLVDGGVLQVERGLRMS